MKTTKQMERHLKGIANHHRIATLLLIGESKKITLEAIVERLRANEKTIGEHTLSPYGEIFVDFLRKFQNLQ